MSTTCQLISACGTAKFGGVFHFCFALNANEWLGHPWGSLIHESSPPILSVKWIFCSRRKTEGTAVRLFKLLWQSAWLLGSPELTEEPQSEPWSFWLLLKKALRSYSVQFIGHALSLLDSDHSHHFIITCKATMNIFIKNFFLQLNVFHVINSHKWNY